MTGSADPIPAIREEDATGEVAAIFADLRATLGVPFVNLIWRHVATIPGGLAWTWGLLRPLYLSPDLAPATDDLREGLHLRDLPVLEDFVCDSAGIDASARAMITALIRDYNRANSVNFLALQVACSVLRGEGRPAVPRVLAPQGARPQIASPAGMPRLLGLDELSPPLLALVRDLDGFGRLGSSGAIASLYRHLAHWPAFLALARTALLAHHQAGSLRSAHERIIAVGRDVASIRLFPLLQGEAVHLGGADKERVRSALDEFTRLMIGRMIVMGAALLVLLPPADGREDRAT